MNINKGNITSRQAILLLLPTILASTLWYYPYIASLEAKQAGWLIPIPAFLIFGYLLKQLNYIIVQNPNLSLLKCFEKSTNKIIGKIFGTLLLVFIIIHFSIFVRAINMRLLSSIFPMVQYEVLILPLLIISILVIKSNIAIITRMNQIILIFMAIILIIILALLLPNISIEKITPISYLDIIPVIKTSIIILNSLGVEIMFILILTSDSMVNKKDFMKNGKQISLILFIIIFVLLLGSIGTFGYYALGNTPHSYMTISKELQLLDFFPGFDSIIITLGIISDFIILNVYGLSLIKILEYLFNIKHPIIFVNILIILIFISSKLISKNSYLFIDALSMFAPIKSFIGFIFPIVMVWIYKIKFNKKKQ